MVETRKRKRETTVGQVIDSKDKARQGQSRPVMHGRAKMARGKVHHCDDAVLDEVLRARHTLSIWLW